jgi:hypothetical protein
LIYCPIDFLHEWMAATTKGKILVHFSVPSLFFKLLKPVRQFPALRLGELFNRGFDRLHGHVRSLTLPSSEREFRIKPNQTAACSAARRWKISM